MPPFRNRITLGRGANSIETTSPRLGLQTLEYNNVRKKRREVGSQDPAGPAVRSQAREESEKSNLSAEGCGRQMHFLTGPWPTHGRGSSAPQMHSDC